MNDKSLNMKLPADLYDRVTIEAKRLNISIASYVRMALSVYTDENKK